ncbi:MAG: hypothetical protein AAGA11_13930 [Pseudomonadota bacterium]
MKELLGVAGDVDVAAVLRSGQSASRMLRREVARVGGSAAVAAAVYVALQARVMVILPYAGWSVVVGLVALGVAGFYLLRGTQHRRKAHLITDTPTTAIATAAQGHVAVQGVARAREGVQHRPFRGMPECVWFAVSVVEVRRNRSVFASLTEWVGGYGDLPTASDMPAGFVIEDPSGHCVVRTAPGRVHCLSADVWEERIGNSIYTVQYLRPGAPVYVLGRFSSHRPDTGAEVRKARWLDRLRALKANRRELLARFDANADGDIDQHEWQAAKDAIQHDVDAELREDSIRSARHRIEPSHDTPLVVSNRRPDVAAGHHATLSLVYKATAIVHFVGGASLLAG